MSIVENDNSYQYNNCMVAVLLEIRIRIQVLPGIHPHQQESEYDEQYQDGRLRR